MSVFLFEKEYCLLEPCEGKLSRTVLRGESTRKGADLPDPDLSTIAYNHLINNQDGYTVKPKFYVINFDDPRRSHRCNPIHPVSWRILQTLTNRRTPSCSTSINHGCDL